jgi:hypothetical protein
MKTTLKFLIIACITAIPFVHLYAQTNPSAVSLPFTLTSQSSATLPAGVAVHRFASIQTTRTLSPANGGDLPNQGSSATNNAGGWYHFSTDGIGLLASGTNPAGAVVVAINTTGKNNITVSWKCKTMYNQSSRDNSIALQYRVGASGNFINVGTTTTYSSAGNANGHTSSTLTETLPAGANNQSVVQVRWIYWESVSTSGSRDKIAVGNISINGTTSGGCSTPINLSASNISTTGADLSWNIVSGASSYEYSVITSSTPPPSGTNTTSTSFSATTLNPGTNYYLHVRTNCGSGNFSGWASYPFITEDTASSSEIKLMSYNLLNYPGSTGAAREPHYRTIMNDVDPDILVVQEVSNSSGPASFLNNVMNFSTTTYSLGTFIDGPDSDNGIYYKTSLFQFISNTPIATALRDINEFKLKHLSSSDTLIIYSVHLKASNTGADAAQRAAEVDDLRQVTDAFASGKYFLVCGDFNIYTSSESAYQKLLENGNNINGKFNDLLSLSGTWNNSSYAIHHTQSPRTTAFGGGATGGMDDRFDMILFSNAITQAGGFDIVPNTYKAYGNDGQHYNSALNTPPYTMYSEAIASALHDASDHLPVVVNMSYTGSRSAAVTSTGRNVKTENSISVFPNPAHGILYVKLNEDITKPVQLKMYDLTGRLVFQSQLESGSKGTTSTVDLSSMKLSKGIYFIQYGLTNTTYKVLID